MSLSHRSFILSDSRMLGASRFIVAARRVSSYRPCPLKKYNLPTSKTRVGYVCSIAVRSPCAQSTSLVTFAAYPASALRRTSSSMSKASHDDIAVGASSLSHVGRLKELWRKYGIVAIGTYLTLYGAVLGSIYLAIDQGWLRTHKKNDITEEKQLDESFNLVATTNKFVKIAEDLGIAQYLEVERVNSKTGTFLLAWVATKFTEPVRLGLTIAMTPRIARFLGRAPKLPPKSPGKIASLIKKQTSIKGKPEV